MTPHEFLLCRLFLVFLVKHHLCDFTFQTRYMLGKFKAKGWFWPLTYHAFVHMIGTMLIAWIVTRDFEMTCACGRWDFLIHFVVDRIKASPHLGGRYKPLFGDDYGRAVAIVKKHYTYDLGSATLRQARRDLWRNKIFWELLGLDQLAHHVTHLFIIMAIMRVTL